MRFWENFTIGELPAAAPGSEVQDEEAAFETPNADPDWVQLRDGSWAPMADCVREMVNRSITWVRL